MSDGRTAAAVSAAIAEAFDLSNRHAKTKKTTSGSDYFAIIRGTRMPTILVECLFIDNENDTNLIRTSADKRRMGEAIAAAIAESRGIRKRSFVEQIIERLNRFISD